MTEHMHSKHVGARFVASLGRFPYLVIVVVGLILLLPFWWIGPSELTFGDDALVHLRWSAAFSEQLWDGEAYPRWLSTTNGGLGSPTFFFYPPMPYYAAGVWHPFSVLTGNAWHALAAGMTTGVILSGITAFLWLRSFVTPTAALVGALLYMALPYHLGVDVYERFAYAELWAFVWMPLVMWGSAPASGSTSLARLARTALYTAIPYALLAIAHIPTLLLFSALPLLHSFLLAGPERRVSHTAAVAVGLALGMGLAAAFIVPAWGDRGFASLSEIATGELHYTHHFLLSSLALPGRTMVRSLDLWICLAPVTALYALISTRRHERKAETLGFWIAITLASVLASTPIAAPIWRVIPILQNVQFPWRFGALTNLSVATTFALLLSRTELEGSRSDWRSHLARLGVCALVSGLFILAQLAVQALHLPRLMPIILAIGLLLVYLRIESSWVGDLTALGLALTVILCGNIVPVARRAMPSPTTPVESPGKFAIEPPEFRIQSVPRTAYNVETVRRLTAGGAAAVRLVSGTGSVRLLKRSPRLEQFSVDASTPIRAILPRYFYPGSVLSDIPGLPNGKVRPSEAEGLVEVELPAGSYVAELVLSAGRSERLGWLFSGVAAALLALLLFLQTRADSDRA